MCLHALWIFKKAFDNYWKLVGNLLHNNANCKIAKLLAFSYSSQECIVRWRNVCSTSFCMSNGTRQGGVLSPYLFARYIKKTRMEGRANVRPPGTGGGGEATGGKESGGE